jgi:hypothetical protein
MQPWLQYSADAWPSLIPIGRPRQRSVDRGPGGSGSGVRLHRGAARRVSRGPRVQPPARGGRADRTDRWYGDRVAGSRRTGGPGRSSQLLRAVLCRGGGGGFRPGHQRHVLGASRGRADRHAVHRRGRQRSGHHAGAGHACRRGQRYGEGLRPLQRRGRCGRRTGRAGDGASGSAALRRVGRRSRGSVCGAGSGGGG